MQTGLGVMCICMCVYIQKSACHDVYDSLAKVSTIERETNCALMCTGKCFEFVILNLYFVFVRVIVFAQKVHVTMTTHISQCIQQSESRDRSLQRIEGETNRG